MPSNILFKRETMKTRVPYSLIIIFFIYINTKSHQIFMYNFF